MMNHGSLHCSNAHSPWCSKPFALITMQVNKEFR